MPEYTFKNTNTGEIETHTFRISQYDEFKSNNPHLERYHSPGDAPLIADPMAIGVQKPPSDFMKYVINPIEQRNKSSITKNTKYSTPREW